MQRWMRIGDFALTDDCFEKEAIRGTTSQVMLGLIRDDSLELQDLRRFLWELGHFDIHRMNQHQVLETLHHCLSTGKVGALPWARMQKILFTPRSSEVRAERDVTAGGGAKAPPARASSPRSEARKPTPEAKPPPKAEPAPRPSRPPPKIEPAPPPPRAPAKVEPAPVSLASAPPLIPDDWNDAEVSPATDAVNLAPLKTPAVGAGNAIPALNTEIPPDNYDLLTDKYINPSNQAQIDHNKAVDIEDLIKSGSPNFRMRDKNLVENARREYESNAVRSVIDYHEFLAIRAYSDDLYRGINPALRSGDPGKWKDLITSADSGLDKLARHSAYSHSGIVTRGMNLDTEIVASLFPDGGTFSDKAFVSSSHDPTKAFDMKVTVTIETLNPQAKIGAISVYGDAEAEVLFKAGCQFDVVSKRQLPDGYWQVHLKEKKT